MVSGLSELIGKHVLFTMVRCDNSGHVLSQNDIHGTVELVGGQPGLRRKGENKLVPLPPLYDQFEKVDREKVFELESTGEKVSDIDYTLLCIKSPH